MNVARQIGRETALDSLIYISTSMLDPATAHDDCEALVAAATDRNRQRGLTGAMMFTGTHFVQVFEGTPDPVTALLSSLHADERHKDIMILERGAISERRFSAWSMAYARPSQFIARQISRAIRNPSPAEQSRAANWLTNIMLEFVAR